MANAADDTTATGRSKRQEEYVDHLIQADGRQIATSISDDKDQHWYLNAWLDRIIHQVVHFMKLRITSIFVKSALIIRNYIRQRLGAQWEQNRPLERNPGVLHAQDTMPSVGQNGFCMAQIHEYVLRASHNAIL